MTQKPPAKPKPTDDDIRRQLGWGFKALLRKKAQKRKAQDEARELRFQESEL